AELQRRNENRLMLRRLRDTSNPFDMPNEVFRRLYCFLTLEKSPKIPKVVRFIMALHFYAQGNYQKSARTHCPMSQSAVSNCITSVTNAIVNNFSGRVIKFPSTLNETTEKNGFFQKFSFPGVIGIIDGIHISIVPSVFGRIPPRAVFPNRKSYYSINCQIVCDSNLKILGICARYPGSVHDSAIWMRSNIYNELKNHYRNGEQSSWLIGGLCPRTAAKIIIACATLYNVLKIANVDDDNYLPDEDEVHVDNEDINEAELHQVGTNIRNNLIRNHFQ
ncbi:hypothetical protein ILUMI_26177, partial [Ignelater luminosus]